MARAPPQASLASLAGLLVLSLVFAGCTSTQAGSPPTTSAATSTTDTEPAPGTTGPPTTAPPTQGPPTQAPPTGTGTGKPKPPAPPREDLGLVATKKPLRQEGTCPCPGLRFQLDPTAPAGKTTWLELRVSWDGTKTSGILPALVPPGTNLSIEPRRGFDDWRIQSFGPAAGEYALDLLGAGAYTLDIRFLTLGERRSPGEVDLPNLVTTVPLDIHVAQCDAVETAEQGAEKCLRLANGVANMGDGPVEVHLFYDRALFALNPLTEGRFIQWLYKPDRTHVEHDAGAAAFHVSHKHWHYAGLAHFQLFKYDPATGLRGAEVSSHHKQGFCFLDWGKMNATDADPSGGSNAQQNCQIPNDQGWTMGISRGYYDYYEASLTDQYVDVADVPDGIYELVSTADEAHSLQELDTTDNSASIVLELKGDGVRLIEERGHYIPLEYRFHPHPA